MKKTVVAELAHSLGFAIPDDEIEEVAAAYYASLKTALAFRRPEREVDPAILSSTDEGI